MTAPGFKSIKTVSKGVLYALKGKEIGAAYQDSADILRIYFTEGSYITLTTGVENIELHGELLIVEKELTAGYGGPFYHLGDLNR